MNAVFSRRSIRSYSDEPVSKESLNLLLGAAMVAPSCRDCRPWHFVVIRDRKILERVPGVHPHSSMVPQAQLAILVCADPRLQESEGYWAQDCAAATENILIEAQHLGLGAVWLGVYPRPERIRGLRELLGIPEPVVPFSLVPVGHPGEHKEPADRFDPKKVHWDRW